MELKSLKTKSEIILVDKESIAEEVGIEVGDYLISINDTIIEDIIEYKYFLAEDYLEVEIEKKDGERIIYEIEKEPGEDLGIEFSNPIIDKVKSCRNKCIFCFIDQLPSGMRETLYFKDDDSRLSFLQGNFITLTNMTDADIEKMVKYKISPVNISVHAMNPELRVKMLNNKNAGKIKEYMEKLNSAGIKMNVQIVLCPDINDKKELEYTLETLTEFYPNVNSVAVVPVGITKYRDGLFDMKTYDENTAKAVIDHVRKLQNSYITKFGTRLVFLLYEFFVMGKLKRPLKDEYEGFIQLENGVGLMTKFEEEIKEELVHYPVIFKKPRKISIATGKSAFKFMNEISRTVESVIKNLTIEVNEIKNEFFGETITVAGLITGSDIIKQLEGKDIGDFLIIPESMMRSGEEIFLDDVTPKDVERALNTKLIITPVDGKSFIKKVLTKEKELI